MVYLIAIDSGHGMETAGKRTPPIPEAWIGKKKGDIIHEKEFNKPAAEFLIQTLERNGFKTLNVSPGTADISLTERYTKANNAKADAFISVHYNASSGVWNSANGIETIVSQYASAKSKELAGFVQSELVESLVRRNRGVKTDIDQCKMNLAVLRNTTMPAILTESGFMDNEEEAKTMLDPVFQKAVAEAMCKGICRFFNINYIAETKIPAAPITRNSSKEDIVWLQTQLNKANKNYQIAVDGVFGQRTRLALLLFAVDIKGWDWSKTWGYTAGENTVKSLAK